jgi:hypothetical protein
MVVEVIEQPEPETETTPEKQCFKEEATSGSELLQKNAYRKDRSFCDESNGQTRPAASGLGNRDGFYHPKHG